MRLGAGTTEGSVIVGVNGSIELLQGLPAGVSVKGLEIEFTPGGGPGLSRGAGQAAQLAADTGWCRAPD
jgi:ribosomal protein L2